MIYVADENSHTHKCPKCGFEWSHSNLCGGMKEAHTCPCGEEVWDKHERDSRISTAHFTGCHAPSKVPQIGQPDLFGGAL